MADAKMRPILLPDCQCKTRRLIVVDNIIRCGNCYRRYSEAKSFNYTDEFLKTLIENADKDDKWYQYEIGYKKVV
jgi:hypothetical protein